MKTKKENMSAQFFSLLIQNFGNLRTARPLSVILEPDGDGYHATFADIPQIYGCGDDALEALEMLKQEFELLYGDLNKDDNWSDEFIRLRSFMNSIVVRNEECLV